MSYVIGKEQQDAKLIGVWLLHQHQQDHFKVEVIKVVDAHQRSEYIPRIIFQSFESPQQENVNKWLQTQPNQTPHQIGIILVSWETIPNENTTNK
jgi:hypothetical protein